MGSTTAPFDYLARRYGRRLEAMAAEALSRLGERPYRHRIEDLVQDVYCKLLASSRPLDPRLRRESQVLAYLRRTVRSAAVDGVRLEAAAKRSAPARWDGPTAAPFPGAPEEPLDPAPTPEQHLMTLDRRRRFRSVCRSANGSTPTAVRDVRLTELALLDGWSSHEISAALGGRLRPSSVDAAVSRVRRRLAAAGLPLPRRRSVDRRCRRRRRGVHPAIIGRCASSPRPVASITPRPPDTRSALGA